MRTLELLMKVLQQNDARKQGLCFTEEVDVQSFVNFWFGQGILVGELEENTWYLYYYGNELCRSKADAVVMLEDGIQVYLYRIEDK